MEASASGNSLEKYLNGRLVNLASRFTSDCQRIKALRIAILPSSILTISSGTRQPFDSEQILITAERFGQPDARVLKSYQYKLEIQRGLQI